MTARKRSLRISVGLGVAAVLAAFAASAVHLASAGTEGGTSLQQLEAATTKYHSLSAAKAAGYGLLKDKQGIACIAMDSMPGMGAMGVHYAKAALVGDGQLDIRTPEAVVYAPTAGGLKLAAVEFVVLKADWLKAHNAAPVMFGHRFNETPTGNRFGLPAYYSLHVWVFRHNAAGTFAMWNPGVSCR